MGGPETVPLFVIAMELEKSQSGSRPDFFFSSNGFIKFGFLFLGGGTWDSLNLVRLEPILKLHLSVPAESEQEFDS